MPFLLSFKGSEFTKSDHGNDTVLRTKFFAKVINDACTDNTPNSPFYVPEANDGKGGTILECNQVYQIKERNALVSQKYTISGMLAVRFKGMELMLQKEF